MPQPQLIAKTVQVLLTCVCGWVELTDGHLVGLLHQRSWREDLGAGFLPGLPQLLELLLPSQSLLNLPLDEVWSSLFSGLQAGGLQVLPPGLNRG